MTPGNIAPENPPVRWSDADLQAFVALLESYLVAPLAQVPAAVQVDPIYCWWAPQVQDLFKEVSVAQDVRPQLRVLSTLSRWVLQRRTAWREQPVAPTEAERALREGLEKVLGHQKELRESLGRLRPQIVSTPVTTFKARKGVV